MNTYKIAGLLVHMQTFGQTAAYAAAYQATHSSHADIVIRRDCHYVRAKQPQIPEGEAEYLATGSDLYRQLINFDGMMIHASAVVKDGKAYLFSADCGTGKSTHTSLWRRVYGDEAVRILNDDKPALRLEDGRWYAYGTPWCGKTGQNANLRVPVAGIAFLEQALENAITPLVGVAAIAALLQQTSKPNDLQLRGRMLELTDKLIAQVPIWKLKCNMEPEAALLSYRVMSGADRE